MVLEPEEHDFLEVSLSRFEERLQFVQLGKLDDLENLARVLDQLQHCQIIQVEVVDDLAEGLVLHLTVKVDDELLIFARFERYLLQEDLLEVD